VSDPKSRKEGRRKVKIGSKEAHVTPFRGRKVKGQGQQTENDPYLWNEKAYEFTLDVLFNLVLDLNIGLFLRVRLKCLL